MGDARREADRLADMPLEESNISARLRRSLSRAGYPTLRDAFDEEEEEVRKVVGKSFDEFTKLVDSFLDDPAKFVKLMSQERKSSAPKPAEKSAPSKPSPRPCPRTRSGSRDRRFNYVHESSLSTPHGQYLKQSQEKAKAVFDDLCDRYDTVLVYQAFPTFSVDLEEIRSSFLKLFKGYPAHPGKVLDISREFLPDLFLVFVADLARDSFSDDNLWGNFTKVLPLSSNILEDLKKLFVDLLGRRNMPLYGRDEAASHYFYTTLLHGGLSGESWEDLWEHSLLPLAEALQNGLVGFGGEISANSILKEIKNPGGRFAPKRESVIKILRKAPDFTIAPLFDAAIRAAAQINSKTGPGSKYVLMDSFGLPEAAVAALNDTIERKVSRRVGSASTGQSRREPAQQIVSLPRADLCLDLDRGAVSIRWIKKQYPYSFLGDRIDFCVDGEKLHEECFVLRQGKCVLDDVEIMVRPQSRYDIELRLMKRSEGAADGFEQVSSHEQCFERSKPGCFEFIQGLDGVFRLRDSRDRLRRTRRVAYVMKEGYYIEPGTGMSPVAVYDSGCDWSGTSVFVYDVEPGASGSIFMRRDGGRDEEVAVWQESYRAHINKHRIIGETAEGLDLFGYMHCRVGDNAGLPRITIEAADGQAAFRDLDITCTCDGEPVSVSRRVVWEDGAGAASSQIELPLERAVRINWHSELVEITARQISNGGRVVFRYRFAVIPIQNFKIEECRVENGVVTCRYSFDSRLNIAVSDQDGVVTEVPARGHYSKKALLKDEYLALAIRSEDESRCVNAKLALAAIDVSIPEELSALSRQRPICLADALAMGSRKGEVVIRALGWRYNRKVYAFAGRGINALCVRDLKQPTVFSLNPLSKPGMFVPNGLPPRNLDMILSIGYGDEENEATGRSQLSWADVDLLRMREGLGFKSACLFTRDGSMYAQLDKPILCNADVTFKQCGRRERVLVDDPQFLPKGSAELPLPPEVAYSIRTKKEVEVTFSPRGRMGRSTGECSLTVTLKG